MNFSEFFLGEDCGCYGTPEFSEEILCGFRNVTDYYEITFADFEKLR